ncbi:Sugar phosphate permease [Paracoccus isoporae]|uniref:Sugar phosphate permease n=1 Tax=Paracoccus isoporae TaxID=591205 RepID=A0A1G6TT11_9RHOB|nr:MFS transporter [Paracoccus isoporae]SDD32238.1 Sugar phosphate permease [Paracoccus isoporae]
MKRFTAGIWVLVLGYTLSQFYRAFMAVLSPVLRQELGAGPGDLAVSSGVWFFAFAAMQIPVGGWLDRFGPRRTAAGLMLVAAAGAAVFAMAQSAWHLHLSMALIGIGCSPALMAAYFIFAREYSPREFGTLAGMFVAVGALGNILSAAPLEAFAQAIGWRAAMWVMMAVTLGVAVAEYMVVRDPAKLDHRHPIGRLADILRLRALWFILPLFSVNYAASAAIRGLWAGPYLEEVFGASGDMIGIATLLMGLAMIAGNSIAGPITRIVGSVRRTILIGTTGTIVVIAALWLFTANSIVLSIALLTLVGFSGASYVLLIAHGRAFLPNHLVGRGVTFLNMFSIGGTGALQFASRPVYRWASEGGDPAAAYSTLFLFFTIPLVVGLFLYVRTQEAPHD